MIAIAEIVEVLREATAEERKKILIKMARGRNPLIQNGGKR